MTSFLSSAARPACLLLALAACGSGNTRPSTGAKPEVTATDIERGGGDPIEQLQAKASGVQVSRTPDGGIAVQIRGSSSFYGGTQPLYVIDDVPVQPGPGGALVGINPHDIESIQVLKNPEDIGIYGVRGANGVILIKMKKPGKRRS